MNSIKWKSPGFITLPENHDNQALVRSLTYKDSSAEYQMRRLKQNARRWRMDATQIKAKLEVLKEQANKCLVWMDPETGETVTYAGFYQKLQKEFGYDVEFPEEWQNEDFDIIPWNKKPFDLRDYQELTVQSFLDNPHSAAELPTGAGKSLVITYLLKRRPVKTLVVTPSKEITTQLRDGLEDAFGKKRIGQYGAGRKVFNKQFTVATAAALSSLKRTLENRATPADKKEKAQEIWDELSKCEALVFDESHTVPAETFEDVCVTGVARNAIYRSFLSATQTRGDGSQLLLAGITGPIQYRKTFSELVASGHLKRVDPCIIRTQVWRPPTSDPKEEIRQNLYRNPNVAKAIANLAEKCVNVAGRQTVILIEEYTQFLLLRNHMTIPFEFAHGTATKQVKEQLPEEFWDCDVKSMVKKFNEGKVPCLIGTTAISTGVDIKPTGALIYAQGGKSEIKLKQGVGRGTRPVAHKNLLVFDFNVIGSPILERQCQCRIDIFEEFTEKKVKQI